MELLKRDNEGQNEYISRIYKNKVELGMTNKETMEAINKELGTSYAESTLRSVAYPFNEGFELGYEKALSSSKGGNNELIAEIEEKRMAMEKERIKLQTTKLEYNRNLRIDSRQELLYENIKEAQERIPLPNFQDIPLEYVDGSYVLCWTDLHYGAKFVSENNSYSREECKRRLEYLASKVKNMCVEKGIGNLHICGLSDDIQGLLRITDVKINDIPVVESVVEVSRLLASILSSISEKTNVTYYHTMASNHSQTRPITGKADLIKEDLEVIIGNYIQDLVSDNDRIEVVLSKKDYHSIQIEGQNILLMHGHQTKSIKDIIKDYSMLHRRFYDIAFIGHYHGGQTISTGESVNGNTEIFVIPSIVGSDPYSDSLKVGAKSMAKMFKLEKGNGIVENYTFVLN